MLPKIILYTLSHAHENTCPISLSMFVKGPLHTHSIVNLYFPMGSRQVCSLSLSLLMYPPTLLFLSLSLSRIFLQRLGNQCEVTKSVHVVRRRCSDVSNSPAVKRRQFRRQLALNPPISASSRHRQPQPIH